MSRSTDTARLLDEAAARASTGLADGTAAPRRRLRVPSRAGIVIRWRRLRHAAGRVRRALVAPPEGSSPELTGLEVALTTAEITVDELAEDLRALTERVEALAEENERLTLQITALEAKLTDDHL